MELTPDSTRQEKIIYYQKLVRISQHFLNNALLIDPAEVRYYTTQKREALQALEKLGL